MQRRILTTALATLLLALPYQSSSRQQDPWIGTWALNLSRSSEGSESPRYKRVTSKIDTWENGIKVTYDMVGTRGGVTHLEWIGRFDGQDYPMQGLDYVMTNAYRRLDDRSYEIVVKVDGTPTSTARVIVSPDGKTLTVKTEGRTADGKPASTTSIYDRQ